MTFPTLKTLMPSPSSAAGRAARRSRPSSPAAAVAASFANNPRLPAGPWRRASAIAASRVTKRGLMPELPNVNEPFAHVCVLACSSCSAAGELADHTARRLQRIGAARMSCLAGVAGRIPSILASVQKASGILLIGGCPLECGASVLRQAGFPKFKQLKLHELGVRKNDAGAGDDVTVAKLVEAALPVIRKAA